MADILQQNEIDKILDLCDELTEDSITSLQNIISLLKNKPVVGTYDDIHITLNQREISNIISKLDLAITSLKNKD